MAETFLQAMLWTVGGYVVVILFTFMVLNFATVGFVGKWMKVKTSRGKLVMVKLRGMIQDKYLPGKLDEGFLVFDTVTGKKFMFWSEKTTHRIALRKDCIYRSAGVNMVDVDEEKKCTVSKDFSAVPGFDSAKWQDLLLRALYKPSIMDDKTKIIIVCIVILAIIVAADIYMGYQNHKAVMAAFENLKSVSSTMSTTTVTGGA